MAYLLLCIVFSYGHHVLSPEDASFSFVTRLTPILAEKGQTRRDKRPCRINPVRV